MDLSGIAHVLCKTSRTMQGTDCARSYRTCIVRMPTRGRERKAMTSEVEHTLVSRWLLGAVLILVFAAIPALPEVD